MIGACSLSSQACDVLLRELTPEDFYVPAHRQYAEAISELYRVGLQVDVTTIAGWTTDHYGPREAILQDLMEIQAETVSTRSAPTYAARIRDRAARRKLWSDLQASTEQVLNLGVDVEEAVETLERRLKEVDLAGGGDPPPLTLDEFLGLDLPYRWLVPNLLERSDRVILTSGEGAGKSTLLRQLAVQFAMGLHPFARQEFDPLTTLIMDVENCLAGETEVLTYDGVRTLGDLAGTTARLLTCRDKGHGWWADCEVRSFGKAALRKVTLERAGVEKVIYATGTHRWLVKRAVRRLEQTPVMQATTDELQMGDHLPRVHSSPIGKRSKPAPFGIAHGVVFGDGHLTGRGKLGNQAAAVHLIGPKNAQLAKYFGAARMWQTKKGTYVTGLPRAFKRYPDLAESAVYLLGWLAGYFAADGTVSATGVATLSSARREDLEFARTVCARLGIGTNPIRARSRYNPLVGRETTQYDMGIDQDTLSADFFLIEAHRHRFETRPARVKRYEWRVMAVEETERFEEVFCAVVPGTERFALADNVLTMNSRQQVQRALWPMFQAALSPDHQTTFGQEPPPAFDPNRVHIEVRQQGIDLLSRRDRQWFTSRVEMSRPDVIITGPIYKMFRGDPIKEEPASELAAYFDELRTRYDCALILEAHAPHGMDGGKHRTLRPFGASLWMRWPEFGFGIRPATDGAETGNYDLVPWRGARDASRLWPRKLRQGRIWPWINAMMADYDMEPAF